MDILDLCMHEVGPEADLVLLQNIAGIDLDETGHPLIFLATNNILMLSTTCSRFLGEPHVAKQELFDAEL